MAKIRFALIGAGGIAKAYVKAFASSDHALLVAVADTDLEAAAFAAEASGARIFDSHVSLLRAGGFDGALICTPPASHAPIALDLLRCGIHVLCEKPFSTDV